MIWWTDSKHCLMENKGGARAVTKSDESACGSEPTLYPIPIEPWTMLLPASFSTIHIFLLGININLDLFRALEQQIQDRERTIFQLERARNSSLNVLTLLRPRYLQSFSFGTPSRMKTLAVCSCHFSTIQSCLVGGKITWRRFC